jgi:hypothetical protein
VAWSMIVLPGRRLALTYARSVPMLTRQALRAAGKRALTGEQVERLRSFRDRLRRAR